MFEQCLMVHGSSLGIMVREREHKTAETEFLCWRLEILSSRLRSSDQRCSLRDEQTNEVGYRGVWPSSIVLPTMTQSCVVIYCNQYFFDTFAVATLK
jgi:hypothetical protein